MKKTIFTAALFSLFLLQSMNAQQRLHFGLQSGVVFSNVVMDWKSSEAKPVVQTNWQVTNATNLYVNYEIDQKFSLTAEPGYMQKSAYDRLLTYIQLPILAEYAVIPKLKVTLGPELNLLLNNDAYKSFRSTDLALQAGAYYGVSSTFDIGLKFSRSLTGLFDGDIKLTDENGSNLGTTNFHQYYFQFYTRYKF